LIDGVSTSSTMSDHFLISIDVFSGNQFFSAEVISCRKYKSIAKDALLADMRVSSLVLNPPDDIKWWISVLGKSPSKGV